MTPGAVNPCRKLGALIGVACIAMLAACGGAEPPGQDGAAVVNPLGTSPAHVAATEVAAGLTRRKLLGVVLTTPNPSADQLFNWAEVNFPQYFPSHSTTLTEGPWVYRSYMQTGVLIGIHAAEVYVTGGPLGAQLLKVGKVSDFVKPPIAVKRTSYENKMAAGAALGPIDKLWPAQLMLPSEEITAGIAAADFFQDGSLSLAAFSGSNNDPTGGPATLPGKAYFFRSEAGKWVDRTELLLKDQTGCIGARKLLVADFNGDGKPDVFASCTGYDAPVNGRLPGEPPRLLLSQVDGTYRNVAFELNCYCHSASAVDVSGGGFADLVVQDNALEGVVYFRNNRDGTFTLDRSRVPAYEPGYMGSRARSIWTVEVLDAWGTGRYDLFLGGVDVTEPNYCCGWTSKIYRNKGNDTWGHDSVVVLPSLPGRATDVYDVVLSQGKLYLLRDGPAPTLSALSMAIQRIDLNTLASTAVYEHVGVFSNGYTTMINWIIVHDGLIKNFSTYPEIAVAR